MARNPYASFTPEIQYRRGAVMGLTVAEAFMLVAFVLLMLLVFWRHKMEDEYKEARELTERLSPEEQAAVADAKDKGELRILLIDLRKGSIDIPKTTNALLSGAVPIAPARLEKLETRARLVDEAEVRRLVEAVAVLSPEHKRTLSNLVALSEAGELVDKVAALQDVLRKRSVDEVADALALKDATNPDDEDILESRKKRDPQLLRLVEAAARLSVEQRKKIADMIERSEAGELVDKFAALQHVLQERGTDEVTDALELRDDLDLYGEYSNKALKEMIRSLRAQGTRVRDRLAKEERARERLVADLKANLGAQIAKVGGRIEATGKIVVPDKILFIKGEAGIRPQVARFLDDFCPRWLATLEESGSKSDIDEIRIEGHSSSEWVSADSPQKAWVLNLDLSQRRAQSVLERCLSSVDLSALGGWVRGKLTAVGYSSSRPVRTDGSEDLRLSRRVVFGTEFSRERLLREIDSDVGEEHRNAGSLKGIARVKDADTIEIQGYGIRLDGIDGLEKSQICERPDGSTWPCGLEATRALDEYIHGREVVCEKLRLGLRRYGGRCRVGGEDLNRWLVRAGWAFAYAKYSQDYALDEKASRMARRGAWIGKVDPPWEWRRKRRDGASPLRSPDAARP